MWNKLFKKKKQSKPSNKSPSDVTGQASASTTKCFPTFRSAKKTIDNDDDRYQLNDNFHYLQYESEVYRKPEFGEGHEYSQLYQPEQHQLPDEHQHHELNEIFIDIPPQNLRLDLCPVCSRKFASEALMKHVVICEKINTKTRKPFDSSKQRLQGTEFTAVTTTSPTAAPNRLQPLSRASPPKTLQRKASETSLKSQPTFSYSSERPMMLNNMTRKHSTVSLGGTPRSLTKKSVQPQPEKCPYCERNFGYKAYDRHVEWCKEKSLIKPSADMASVSAAKERMKTRINYKAPNLRTKRGTTRDKYSNSCNGSTNSLADFDSHLNSMSSSMTSENGLYDPFLSAKKQLEELFSPTTAPTTQMINSMMATPASTSIKNNNNNDIMSKSLTLTSHAASPKTPQPIPKMQSNFKRTSSLRISNRKPKPAIYTPPAKSNIHCGITDDGPISPNFVKATDYDELPIKSPYSAIKMCETKVLQNQIAPRGPASTMPSIYNQRDNHPLLRDKQSALVRKNLKLDLRNPNMPSSDYPLSKTDSLALFLKYENEMTAKLTEKELKDKSNSLSKQSQGNLTQNGISYKEHKLPDINNKPTMQQPQSQLQSHQQSQQQQSHSQNQQQSHQKLPSEERSLISIDNLNQNSADQSKSHSAPVKLNSACENLPLLNTESASDKSRSPSIDRKAIDDDSPKSSRKSGGSTTLRRKKKYNMDNILFDTDPEVKTSSSSDNSNNNSLKRPESRTSNAESVFEDFDFDQFIESFKDDDQFPIFKDYKMMLNKSANASVNEQNNNYSLVSKTSPAIESVSNTKPIPIQKLPIHRSKDEISGLEKLDNLCKMLSGNSDSEESNSLETNESHTIRSKSSADSAYGSLSRQSQSPFEHRKLNNHNMYTFRPTPPPPPRQHLELKTTEIVLNPVKPPNFQETVMLPRNGISNFNRAVSTESNDLTFSKFCHECGYKFVVPTAKFCIECGVRRIKTT